MKAIKITASNSDKIEEALAQVNRSSRAFTITLYDQVQEVAKRAEEKLGMLPKKDRAGAVAEHKPAGPSANAYKYAAKTTRVFMERRSTGWFLTSIVEDQVYPRDNEKLWLKITRKQANEIQRRSTEEFIITGGE